MTKINQNNHHNPKKQLVVTAHPDAKNAKKAKKKPNPSEKAGSVHDLRRCAVSSLLKVPPQYTTFNETRRLPLTVGYNPNSNPDSQQVIVLNSERVNLMVENHAQNEQQREQVVLVNGFSLARIFKLAKKWTFRTKNDGDCEGADGSDADLPLEDLQDSANRQKRASL